MPITSSSRSDQICPDLVPSESDFLRRIDSAKTNDQIEFLLAEINELIKKDISLDSRKILRRCRQKAYDRRRKLQHSAEEEASMPPQNNLFEFPPVADLQRSQQALMNEMKSLSSRVDQLAEKLPSLPERTPAKKESSSPDFLSGFFSQLEKLRGDTFLRNFPPALICVSLSAASAWFVAKQITPLYQAFNFDQPELAAWGSIAMATVFSGIYGALRSRTSGFMCALVVLYEILFVCAGTRSHEALQLKSETEAMPEVAFAKEALANAKAAYDRQKARYENKEDKMFQNAWFKAGYVDTAWAAYSEKLSAYTGLINTHTEKNGGFGLQELLKLFYRVSAVVLLMMVSGLAVRKTRDSVVFQT